MRRTLSKAVAPWAMTLLTASFLALLTACPAEQLEPTPDAGGTAEAGVRATKEADASHTATTEATIAAEVSRQAVEPTPAPTATPVPAATPPPLPTAALALKAICSNGVVVRDLVDSEDLVSDCVALLEAKAVLLAGDEANRLPGVSLNWGAETSIYE